jgi:hypothetical protein
MKAILLVWGLVGGGVGSGGGGGWWSGSECVGLEVDWMCWMMRRSWVGGRWRWVFLYLLEEVFGWLSSGEYVGSLSLSHSLLCLCLVRFSVLW